MTIREPARDIPVVAEADVVVVGGGTAGLVAAVAAGRTGADTLLVERYGYVGGASTGGLVITLPGDRQNPLLKELEERLTQVGGAALTDKGWLNWCPEKTKWIGLQMLEEAKVRMLFHAWSVGCAMDGERIDAVIVESKAGRQAVKAKMIVDCTGDADIAAFAGAPWVKGDENGDMQTTTMMFVVSGVEREKWAAVPEDHRPPQHMSSCFTEIYPGHLNVWGGSIGEIDGTDPWDLTRAENVLRQEIGEWGTWMSREMPGFEDAYISLTSPQVGIRETRRIVGDCSPAKADWDAATMFEDHIGFAYDGQSLPYGSLAAQKVDNLLVGGRCISHERDILGPIRLIPACMVSGQAAGTAAALAADSGTTTRALDLKALQARLKDDGVTFPKT